MVGSEHRRISFNILARRWILKMTQKELSEAPAISRMERGKIDFTIKKPMVVAEALRIDCLELIDLKLSKLNGNLRGNATEWGS